MWPAEDQRPAEAPGEAPTRFSRPRQVGRPATPGWRGVTSDGRTAHERGTTQTRISPGKHGGRHESRTARTQDGTNVGRHERGTARTQDGTDAGRHGRRTARTQDGTNAGRHERGVVGECEQRVRKRTLRTAARTEETARSRYCGQW